jgi:tol-pal system protein YbgF
MLAEKSPRPLCCSFLSASFLINASPLGVLSVLSFDSQKSWVIAMKRSVIIHLCFCGMVITSCVPPEMSVIEREQRRLRAENTNVRAENSAMRRDLDAMRSSVADTRASLQGIQRDLNVAEGKLEEIQHRLEREIGRSSQEGGQRVKELEGRLGVMEEELKVQASLLKAREDELRSIRETLLKRAPDVTTTARPPGVKPSGGIQLGRPPVTPATDAEKKEYDEARKLLQRNKYRPSISRFKEFLKKYPKSAFADNAQYWIGEGHYALKEYDQAILEFDAVRRNYPKGEKVPAALLKLGFAFAELGDKVDARLILRELIDQYPQSEEAGKAKEKLKALES